MVLNLVDKIGRLPLPLRQRLWSKLVYVDAGASDFVVPPSLYYRLVADTFFAMANRFPAVLKRRIPICSPPRSWVGIASTNARLHPDRSPRPWTANWILSPT